jgi:TrpR-related protein YerC/YecD
MPRLSGRRVSPKQMGYFVDLLCDAFTLLVDRKEMGEFLKEFLTPTEVRYLAKRFLIAIMLRKGYDWQTIEAHLKVGDDTIARVNNRLKYGNGALKGVIDQIIEIEEKRQLELESRGLPKRYSKQTVGVALARIIGYKIAEGLGRKPRKDSVKLGHKRW